MFNRIKAIFRALFGWMIRSAEDPEMLLTQYMDNLRSKVPQMNQDVANIVAGQKEIEIRLDRATKLVPTLQDQCQQAVKLGDDHKDAALQMLTQLQAAKDEVASLTSQLERAKAMSQKAMDSRSAFIADVNDKITEAKTQISRSRQAQIEEQMSSMMMSFQTGDDSDTLNRMTEKVDQRLAQAAAKSQVASTSVDAQIADVKRASHISEANSAYEEMQRQLGITPPLPAEPSTKTMEAIPVVPPTEARAVVEGTN